MAQTAWPLVATVNTFKLKSAVRAVGKAYGRDEAALKRLARQLPRGWHPDPRRRETLSDDDLLNRYPDAADRAVVAAALTWSADRIISAYIRASCSRRGR